MSAQGISLLSSFRPRIIYLALGRIEISEVQSATFVKWSVLLLAARSTDDTAESANSYLNPARRESNIHNRTLPLTEPLCRIERLTRNR